jgi:hypothetical protein
MAAVSLGSLESLAMSGSISNGRARLKGAEKHLPWWPLQVQIRCAACNGRLGDVAKVKAADGH